LWNLLEAANFELIQSHLGDSDNPPSVRDGDPEAVGRPTSGPLEWLNGNLTPKTLAKPPTRNRLFLSMFLVVYHLTTGDNGILLGYMYWLVVQ